MNSNNLDLLITDYISSDIEEDDNQFYSSKLAILDTIGCIIEASNHEEVVLFASKNNLSINYKNPFKNLNVSKSYETISWYLTVLTRWFDYNDTFWLKSGHIHQIILVQFTAIFIKTIIINLMILQMLLLKLMRYRVLYV